MRARERFERARRGNLSGEMLAIVLLLPVFVVALLWFTAWAESAVAIEPVRSDPKAERRAKRRAGHRAA
jgi:hypothetical protein